MESVSNLSVYTKCITLFSIYNPLACDYSSGEHQLALRHGGTRDNNKAKTNVCGGVAMCQHSSEKAGLGRSCPPLRQLAE